MKQAEKHDIYIYIYSMWRDPFTLFQSLHVFNPGRENRLCLSFNSFSPIIFSPFLRDCICGTGNARIAACHFMCKTDKETLRIVFCTPNRRLLRVLWVFCQVMHPINLFGSEECSYVGQKVVCKMWQVVLPGEPTCDKLEMEAIEGCRLWWPQEQKERFLPQLATGDLIGHFLTEFVWTEVIYHSSLQPCLTFRRVSWKHVAASHSDCFAKWYLELKLYPNIKSQKMFYSGFSWRIILVPVFLSDCFRHVGFL